MDDVTVCLPARDEADTIGPILTALAPLGVRLLVVDDGSGDGTAAVARGHGAEVVAAADLLPALGPTLGKGDVVWRAQAVVETDVIVLLDADLEGVGAHWVRALAAPLADPGVQLVKGAFTREGAGRVTELLARPLLRAFHPELADLRQPLSGQVAVRREWLASMPVTTGYGLEIGMLLETWRRAGRAAIADAELGVLRNRHQALGALAGMADDVLSTFLRQLEREGRAPVGAVAQAPLERPPYQELHGRDAA